MANLRKRLEEIPEGTPVRLRMKSGYEISGRLAAVEGNVVRLEQADKGGPVAADDVSGVIVLVASEGPE